MAFEGKFGQHNQALHTGNDTLATMGNNTTHAARFSRLAAAYVAELAKGTIPPPVRGLRARRAER
jgi:leucyl aminopeptidase